MTQPTKPAPGAYLRIAKSCMSLGEYQLALDVLERGIARFAKDVTLHIMKGEIFLQFYNRKKTIDHLKTALGNYEKALKINPNNYLALLRSSKIYVVSGSLGKAKERIAALLKVSPNDEQGQAMLQKVKQKEKQTAAKQAQSQPAEKKQKAEETKKPAQEAIAAESVQEQIEDDGGLITFQDDEEESIEVEAEDYENLTNRLSLFSRIDGLKGIFLVDKYGMPIKTINRSDLDESHLANLLSNVYRASLTGVKRMGLGGFQRGQIMTAVGNIYIVNAGFAILGILMDAEVDTKKIETRIKTYLEDITS